MKTLADVDVLDKRVFLRADLDVVSTSKGPAVNGEREAGLDRSMDSDLRLMSLKPTVDWLIGHQAKQIFIAGHVGRPVSFDPQLSTRHLEAPLEAVLRRSVTYKQSLRSSSFGGFRTAGLKKDLDLSDGTLASMAQIILLENLRFWPGEEKNDSLFARQLAGIADVYVNDAFATCHREHASIVGVPALLPHAAGLHLQKEVEILSKLLENPARPMVAVVGGVKIDTKIGVIENLAKAADTVVVGGYLPIEIEKKGLKFAQNVLVAGLTENAKDVSDSSIVQTIKLVEGAKTVVWNGNLGLTEEGFTQGTERIARAIVESQVYSVVGGGNTTDFLAELGLLAKFSFASTGGGAMLEFLTGKELPALAALD